MSTQLLVIAGPDKGRSFPLSEADIFVVGRGRASHTQLSDPLVSRTHCQLKPQGEDYYIIVDLGSATGTFLNGKRIEQGKLRPGDVLQIGDSQLALQVEYARERQTRIDPPSSTELAAASRPAPAVASRPTAAAAPLKQAPPSATRPPRTLNELAGKSLGRFKVGTLLAKGRFSYVFRAHDEQNDREVALKVMRPEHTADPDYLQRFMSTMKTVLPLRHPNLVNTYAAGKNENFCWVAMELVEGETIRQAMHKKGVGGRMDWRHAFGVALYLSQGLQYAHEHHIVHCNITPRHVLIRSKDGLAKLADLMLATAFEGVMVHESTQPGQVPSDLAYLSPEQTFKQADVDVRSDIYGLGATLYVMIAGKAPFEAATTEGLIQKIREGNLDPPRKFQLSIPGIIEGLVLKMMARDPDSRFQTAGELIKEIDLIAKVLGA